MLEHNKDLVCACGIGTFRDVRVRDQVGEAVRFDDEDDANVAIVLIS